MFSSLASSEITSAYGHTVTYLWGCLEKASGPTQSTVAVKFRGWWIQIHRFKYQLFSVPAGVPRMERH